MKKESIQELWLPISGYIGIYEISDMGRIRTLERDIYYKKGKNQYKRVQKPKIMKLQENRGGYLWINLNRAGKHKVARIHRLVAKAFIPLVNGKYIVNHKNGIKTDNRVVNLEWTTSAENNLHAYEVGIKKSHRAGYSDYYIFMVLRLLERYTCSEVAKSLKMQPSSVHQVANKKSYKRVHRMLERVDKLL